MLDEGSVGRVTVVQFPDIEAVDEGVVVDLLNEFVNLDSELPKLLIMDNPQLLSNDATTRCG